MKQSAQDIVKTLPGQFQEIAFAKFNLNESLYIVKVRVKSIAGKSPLFIWDLSRNQYVSSLYFNSENNRFYFDVMVNEKRVFYSIGVNLDIIENDFVKCKKDDYIAKVG